jgi:hypothetical protein
MDRTTPESPEALRADLLELIDDLSDEAVLRLWRFVRAWVDGGRVPPPPPGDPPVPR